MSKQKDSGRPRRYLRKKAVAERYGVHERSVDRMKDDGRFPLWDEAKLDASDRAAALLPRPTQAA